MLAILPAATAGLSTSNSVCFLHHDDLDDDDDDDDHHHDDDDEDENEDDDNGKSDNDNDENQNNMVMNKMVVVMVTMTNLLEGALAQCLLGTFSAPGSFEDADEDDDDDDDDILRKKSSINPAFDLLLQFLHALGLLIHFLPGVQENSNGTTEKRGCERPRGLQLLSHPSHRSPVLPGPLGRALLLFWAHLDVAAVHWLSFK